MDFSGNTFFHPFLIPVTIYDPVAEHSPQICFFIVCNNWTILYLFNFIINIFRILLLFAKRHIFHLTILNLVLASQLWYLVDPGFVWVLVLHEGWILAVFVFLFAANIWAVFFWEYLLLSFWLIIVDDTRWLNISISIFINPNLSPCS